MSKTIMNPSEVAQHLDSLLAINDKTYPLVLEQVKRNGYRVFRNSQGKHQVRFKFDDGSGMIEQFLNKLGVI